MSEIVNDVALFAAVTSHYDPYVVLYSVMMY